MDRDRERAGWGLHARPPPEELPLLDEVDLESPAQLPAVPQPPVADLPMPAELRSRVVSLVNIPRTAPEAVLVAYR